MYPTADLHPRSVAPAEPRSLRALTHKACDSQVLVSDLDGDEVRVRIPRAHRLVETGRRDVPLVLLVEALRQAGFAFVHTRHGVPADVSFLLDEAGFARRGERIAFPPHGPIELMFRMRSSAESARGGRFDAVVRDASGAVRARGHAITRWLTTAQYAAIRRAAPPVVAKRMERGDVHWRLDDPFFFDHPLDHLPGMAFVAATADRLGEGDGVWRFLRFAELDAPVRMRRTAEELHFLQRGETVAAFRPDDASR